MKKNTVFLIGTRWFGVLGPCSEIIDRLVENEIEVYVFGQKDDHFERYFNGNCILVEINMKRSYFTPLHDFLDIVKIFRYVIKLKPLAVHSFNPKPALLSYGSILFYKHTRYFIGVTGLGNTFIRAPKLSKYIAWGLRKACSRSNYVFFQNQDDVEMFQSKRLVVDSKIMKFIGPGVDLNTFYPRNFEEINSNGNVIKIGCTARLIWQKGIREYLTAAAELLEDKNWKGRLEFYLYGEIDAQHPDCVDPEYVSDLVKKNVVKHIPWTDDIALAVRELDIFVLHSYREGAPRAILEASASGLPTIGSDAIGVRELVIDGVTGYLTPLHDIAAIKSKIILLAENRELRQKMGRAARVQIGEKYSLTNATTAQLEMYQLSNIL